jgi:uncharacterized membrane protein
MTWITGAALLVIVYYAGGRALLVDPSRSEISVRAGLAIAIGTIAGAFVLYETLWRTIGERAPRVAGTISIALLVAAVELLLWRLSGRAAFVHVGAMLATLMAGNVVFTIMPSQRELVAALSAGREPSQTIADRAKTRSIHNNYFTFPVIILMMSAHFPSLYAGRGDLAVFTIIASGALIRHILNIRFTFRAWKPALAAAIAATAALLVVAMRPTAPIGVVAAVPQATGPVAFADVRRVIDRRCAACHSATPSDVSLGVTPAGVAFDMPQQIQVLTERIRERAVIQRTMPPGNKTRITDAERALLARWIANGATIR